MKLNLDFHTKDTKWEVHLQESCTIAAHRTDKFKQSPLKPVSAFREPKTSKQIQGIKLFVCMCIYCKSTR